MLTLLTVISKTIFHLRYFIVLYLKDTVTVAFHIVPQTQTRLIKIELQARYKTAEVDGATLTLVSPKAKVLIEYGKSHMFFHAELIT